MIVSQGVSTTQYVFQGLVTKNCIKYEQGTCQSIYIGFNIKADSVSDWSFKNEYEGLGNKKASENHGHWHKFLDKDQVKLYADPAVKESENGGNGSAWAIGSKKGKQNGYDS